MSAWDDDGLVGPNCLGLFNAPLGYFPIFSASFENGWPTPGVVGIASQSGAYGSHLFAAARDRGIGVPVLVTTGNEADLHLADVIEWMAARDEVEVIANHQRLFVELEKRAADPNELGCYVERAMDRL